jgi:tetratricopeptide (TPR) repeat protein
VSTTTRQSATEAADGRAKKNAEFQAPDPWMAAGIMHALFGRREVSARAAAAACRVPLGRMLAELEHARLLGLVDRGHPGYYRCTGLAGQAPVPEPAATAAARQRAGRYLLACSRRVAETMPGSLLPPARIRPLPEPDPTIADAHAGFDWAQAHRPALLRVAGDAAREAAADRRFGLLAVDLALAGIAGAMAAGDLAAWEQLARIVFTTALAIEDRLGQGYGLEHLGKARKQQGLFEKARRAQRDALTLRERHRDVRAIICSTNALGLAYWAQGELDAARALFEQAMALADTVTDRDFSALTRQNLAGVLVETPELSVETFAEASDLLDHAAACHAKVGALQALANCHRLHAAGLRRSHTGGDFAAAIQAARAGVAAIDASGEIGLAGHEYAELARVLHAAGRDAQARAWAETAIALFHTAGDSEHERELRAQFEIGAPAQPAQDVR